MDRNHSRLIVVLLAGILLVLSLGREAFFWACLGVIAGLVAIGLIGLIVWAQGVCLWLLFGEDLRASWLDFEGDLRALAWSFRNGGPWLSQLAHDRGWHRRSRGRDHGCCPMGNGIMRLLLY